jgi:hypothetical protein
MTIDDAVVFAGYLALASLGLLSVCGAVLLRRIVARVHAERTSLDGR